MSIQKNTYIHKVKTDKYVQAKMVNWFQPKMLLNIGLKAVISGVFGNYADRRELEAALGNSENDNQEWEDLERKYRNEPDMWIDFVNDTGDGFNSTFAIASTVARKNLALTANDDGKEYVTNRGRILIFGGDEVYPFPTLDAYTNKFKIPFASASDPRELFAGEDDHPDMYAIPGNHDWYDGLGNFIKLFCQQRSIGIWRTKQHRSYFSLSLPHNYWIWATDIQLNSDIDAPQLDYFEKIAKEKMKEGDKIILVTAEPAWVYKQIRKEDQSFDRLEFFINTYVHNEGGTIGKQFKLAATLTGDLHHYARYCSNNKPLGHQYITAGGGGAFLHLTHNLPEELESIKHGRVHRQSTFPGTRDSKKLLRGNFKFPFINPRFTGLLWSIYFAFFWIIESNRLNYFEKIKAGSFTLFLSDTIRMLAKSPGTTVLMVILTAGFYAFTDTNVNRQKVARCTGALHAIVQLAILILVMYFIGVFVYQQPESFLWPYQLSMVLAVCLAGSLLASLTMGAYLYLSNISIGMHIDEASSSLACPDYKNFLRLNLHAEGLTIYAVGITRVPRKWKQHYHSVDESYTFTGDEVKCVLLEEPIRILNKEL